MHNILIKNSGDYEMRAVDTESASGLIECIEEYMGSEFANCIRANFITTNESLNDKLEEVQNELNEAREEADWANDELEDTNDKLRDKENALKSAMKGLKELAEKLENSTFTVEQLDSIKEDIEEMTCMLNLEFE